MEIRVKIEEEDEPSRTRVCGTVACTRFLRDNRTKSGGGGIDHLLPLPREKEKRISNVSRRKSLGRREKSFDRIQLENER